LGSGGRAGRAASSNRAPTNRYGSRCRPSCRPSSSPSCPSSAPPCLRR
jgi:hypothetical protein